MSLVISYHTKCSKDVDESYFASDPTGGQMDGLQHSAFPNLIESGRGGRETKGEGKEWKGSKGEKEEGREGMFCFNR